MSDLYYAQIYNHPITDVVRETWHVLGPSIAGGWDGTVPQSHDGMTKEAAERLAMLLNRAYHAGRVDQARAIRNAIQFQ